MPPRKVLADIYIFFHKIHSDATNAKSPDIFGRKKFEQPYKLIQDFVSVTQDRKNTTLDTTDIIKVQMAIEIIKKCQKEYKNKFQKDLPDSNDYRPNLEKHNLIFLPNEQPDFLDNIIKSQDFWKASNFEELCKALASINSTDKIMNLEILKDSDRYILIWESAKQKAQEPSFFSRWFSSSYQTQPNSSSSNKKADDSDVELEQMQGENRKNERSTNNNDNSEVEPKVVKPSSPRGKIPGSGRK